MGTGTYQGLCQCGLHSPGKGGVRDLCRGLFSVSPPFESFATKGFFASPLSQAEVGLGDLGHVENNFGASWDLGTRGNANFISQRKFSTSAMLLFEVAFFCGHRI